MNIPVFSSDPFLLLKERHAERQALQIVSAASFTDCLKRCGLMPTMEVVGAEASEAKQGSIIVRGSDLCNTRVWEKFLRETNQDPDACQLTDVGEALARQYTAWLLNQHTKRYRFLTTEGQLSWLEQVVSLAVIHHLMHKKYTLLSTQGCATFADPWVAAQMAALVFRQVLLKDAARPIHHAMKEPEMAQQHIEQLYTLYAQALETQASLPSEPLPALPASTTPAFPVLAWPGGEQDA